MNERANWPAFTVVRSRFFSPFLLRNLFVIHSSSSASSPSRKPHDGPQDGRRNGDAGHGLAEVRRVEGRTNRGAGIEVIIVADHFIEEVVVFLIAIENDFLFAPPPLSLSLDEGRTDGKTLPPTLCLRAGSPIAAAARSPPLCRRRCIMPAGGNEDGWREEGREEGREAGK